MIKKKIVIIGFLLIISVIVIVIVSTLPIVKIEEEFSYCSDPIIIKKDSDFANYSFSGDGTANYPYIIENLQFKGLQEAIRIESITVSFVIKNCNFIENNNGISIVRTGSGLVNITGNFFSKNAYSGLKIFYLKNAIIEKNIFQNDGIYMYSYPDAIDGIIIKDNIVNEKKIGYFANQNNFRIGNTEEYGQLIFYNCRNVSVSQLTLENTSFAIHMMGCDGISVDSCNFYHNRVGLELYWCTNITVTSCNLDDNYYGLKVFFPLEVSRMNVTSDYDQNIFSDSFFSNSFQAVTLAGVVNYKFYNNYIAVADHTGLVIGSCKQGLITDNHFYCNERGLWVHKESFDNFIHHNIFDNNHFIQAYDNSENTTWYNPDLFHGNWWTDCIEGEPYLIRGSAGAYDWYPLRYVSD